LALTIVEALRLPESPPQVRWSEPDVLEPIIRTERPAIILGGHLGNWELAAWAIARRGGRLHLVVAPPHNPFVARFMDEHRRRCGVVPHDRDSSVRPLLAALRRSELVGTAADQFPGWTIGVRARDSMVNVPFLRRETAFGTGMFRLALSARVPVVALNAVRCGELNDGTEHQFEVVSELIWDGEPPLPTEVDMVGRWSAWLELEIRAHPEQYLWLHRRWKRTAPVANSPFVRVSAEVHPSSE
jgi:KDO2-lipid IV(A) lauroyltransferase